MTYTSLEHMQQRASELGAILTIIYRPLADAPNRHVVIVDDNILPANSFTDSTLLDAASGAFAPWDAV